MEMSFAFFADAATVPADGKVYVLGGGFSALALPQLPGMASFAVVAGFRFTAADAGQVQVVELRFVDNLGKLVLPPTTMRFESAGPPPDRRRRGERLDGHRAAAHPRRARRVRRRVLARGRAADHRPPPRARAAVCRSQHRAARAPA